MLRHRLFFGTLMTILFAAVVIFDGWLDGSLTVTAADDKTVRGTLLCILIVIITAAANLEFAKLVASRNVRYFYAVSIISSILLATTWYWQQLIHISPLIYVFCVFAFTLMAFFLCQHILCGVAGVIANCGANCFAVCYIGFLSAFVMAIRVEFGPIAILTFIFVVKSADIGAYTIGSLFGRHKFSPNISPGKTWEGMAGALAASILVSIAFSAFSGIMTWPMAVIFGFCFAFIGQLGDLAESMIKRDVRQKDASNCVPGFGGILDITDSIVITAPFAYLFYRFIV